MVVLIATPYCHEINNLVTAKNKKTSIMCANCGGYGHLYKSCNHPVISYGIICYKIVYDENFHDFYPQFLMVQRKDSLSYVEFIRGKYCPKNRVYIMKLFTNMTVDERLRIKNNIFDFLWKSMWCKTEDETNKNFTKEYSEASEKFSMLRNGYLLKSTDDSDTILNFSFDYILENTTAVYTETEWGFPKGRRNINEDDISCALREFKEESGIHIKSIRLLSDIKPLEEIFSGSNKIRYKHVYYLARIKEDYQQTIYSKGEIKDVKWFSFEEMIEHIRPYNVERRELAKRVMSVIMKKISY
jgi:ADP-ribose pyrophosphatase YjhB (NUDIX family)